MALEELAAIGVVENDRSDEEDDPVGVVNWCLSGDDGAVIVSVFEAHRASSWGWDETWVYTPTSPPIKEEESSSTKPEPTLRPTLDDPSNQDIEPSGDISGEDVPTCWQCGKELVWTDEQRIGVCSRCYPEANLWREEGTTP
jgi:hypothetical protein